MYRLQVTEPTYLPPFPQAEQKKQEPETGILTAFPNV